jgi:hypothetical protein
VAVAAGYMSPAPLAGVEALTLNVIVAARPPADPFDCESHAAAAIPPNPPAAAPTAAPATRTCHFRLRCLDAGRFPGMGPSSTALEQIRGLPGWSPYAGTSWTTHVLPSGSVNGRNEL